MSNYHCLGNVQRQVRHFAYPVMKHVNQFLEIALCKHH
jgi:hypothetical protein